MILSPHLVRLLRQRVIRPDKYFSRHLPQNWAGIPFLKAASFALICPTVLSFELSGVLQLHVVVPSCYLPRCSIAFYIT